MKRLYNLDHQAQVLAPDVTVQPGEPHDFPDDAQIAGLWSATNPRAPRSKPTKTTSGTGGLGPLGE